MPRLILIRVRPRRNGKIRGRLNPRKGTIAVGPDADVVLRDAERDEPTEA
jgi:hypothetical protein